MKSTAVFSAIALAATVFSVAASAQTGRPSTQEVQDRSTPAHVTAADEEVGSYARYLMLNGTTRDEALIEARNVDHPAPRKVASRSTRTDATSQQ